MTKEEFIDFYNLEEGTVILEPWDVFKKGIIGINENHCQIIYGYYKLLSAIADENENYWNEHHSENEEKPEFLMDAMEDVDYNTIRSLPYIASQHKGFEPIVVMEIEDEI